MKKLFFISIALFIINTSVFSQIFDLYSFPYRRTVDNINFVLSYNWGGYLTGLDSTNIIFSGENLDTITLNCYYTQGSYPAGGQSIDTINLSNKLYENSYYFKIKVITTHSLVGVINCVDSCYYSRVMVYNDTKIDTINNEFGEFNVYPNPTSDLIFISYKLEKKQDINFEMYNEAGISVYNKNINKTKSDNIVVDVSNFNKGIYFVKLRTKNNFITKKIIIE